MPKSFQNLFKTKSNTSLSEIGAASLSKSNNYLGRISTDSSTNRIHLLTQLSSKLEEIENVNDKTLSLAGPVSNLNQTDLVFDELSVILNKSSSQKVSIFRNIFILLIWLIEVLFFFILRSC